MQMFNSWLIGKISHLENTPGENIQNEILSGTGVADVKEELRDLEDEVRRISMWLLGSPTERM